MDRAGARRRRARHRADGALRLREDQGTRHPRSDRGDLVRRQPYASESGRSEAAVVGDLDRLRRPVRRGRPDHHDGRRGRLAVCPVLSSHGRRAQDAAGRRRRRRHDRDFRHADCGRAARRRIASVRMEAAQLSAGCRRAPSSRAVCRPFLFDAGTVVSVHGASEPAGVGDGCRGRCRSSSPVFSRA